MAPADQVVVVRGSGDVGSAVAHRLFSAGYPVLIHDVASPSTPRRGMAFADAFFDGSAVLSDVVARRVDLLGPTGPLNAILAGHGEIPIVTASFDELLAVVQPNVLVDARMRKRAFPERQRGLAPLTIGLGPNFVAGDTVDLVIETRWGDGLGAVLASGSSRPLSGEPRSFAGHARERFIYAAGAGLFRTPCSIGQAVQAGQVVGSLDGRELVAPLAGILRGLTRDGVRVEAATKCVEVDPRGDAALVFGIGERPATIARGVLTAIEDSQT